MITITEKKIYSSQFTLKDCVDKKVIPPDMLPFYLSDTVEFGDDLTFGRFFKLIIENRKLFNIIFHKAMGGYPIDDFIDDFNYTKAEKPDNFILEVYWGTDYADYRGNKHNNQRELIIFPEFHGYGKMGDDSNKKSIKDYAIGVSMQSPGKYKKYKFKLNNKFIVYGDIVKVKGNSQLEKLLEADKCELNLFQVIQAVLYEITWHGSPKQRNEMAESLEQTSYEVKQDIKDGTLKEKTVSIEELLKIKKPKKK